MTVVERIKTIPDTLNYNSLKLEISAALFMYWVYVHLVDDNFHVIKRGVNEE